VLPYRCQVGGEYRLCRFLKGGKGISEKSTYLVLLAGVVWSWDVSSVHCAKVVIRLAGSGGRVEGVLLQLAINPSLPPSLLTLPIE